jgi:hypothetical protein
LSASPRGDIEKNVHPWRHEFVPHVKRLAAGALLVAVVAGLTLTYAASASLRGHTRAVAGWIRKTRRRLAVVGLGLAAVTVTVGAIIWRIWSEGETGEPFTFTNGISIWPTELIRVVGALLAIGFSVKVWSDLEALTTDLSTRFFPDMSGKLDARRLKLSQLFLGPNRWATIRAVYAAEKAAAIDVDTLWTNYVFQISPASRMARVIPIGLVFYALGGAAMLLLGVPHTPSRGGMSFWVDRVLMLGICVPSFILLLFSVVDAIRLCDRFTRELALPARTAWSVTTRRAFSEESGVPEEREAIYRWIDIKFVARWTATLNGMIYYPFSVMLVMLLARSTLFDRFDTPGGLLAVFAASLLYAMASAVILHRAAERGRRVVLDRLTNESLKAMGDPSPEKVGAAQLALMIEEVRGIGEGAFAPLLQQPAVKAALLPLGGAGSAVLLEYALRLL